MFQNYFNKNMKIRVTTISGKSFLLNVNPTDTLDIIKQKILDTREIPPISPDFFTFAKQLDDHTKTLADYKICDGDKIHLVLNI